MSRPSLPRSASSRCFSTWNSSSSPSIASVQGKPASKPAKTTRTAPKVRSGPLRLSHKRADVFADTGPRRERRKGESLLCLVSELLRNASARHAGVDQDRISAEQEGHIFEARGRQADDGNFWKDQDGALFVSRTRSSFTADRPHACVQATSPWEVSVLFFISSTSVLNLRLLDRPPPPSKR